MPSIPLWVIGRTVTAVVATPLIADANGLFSTHALGALSFTAIADEISYASTVQTVEISALTSSRKNEIPLEQDDRMIISEILRASTNGCLGARAWTAAGGSWCRFQFSRGGNAISLYGAIADYEENVTKGKCIARLAIHRVTLVGEGNPVYGAAFVG